MPTTDLSKICCFCQRPESAHCAGCGACWPDDACRLDCDINEAHDRGAYDERNIR